MSFERPETLPKFLLPIARYALEQKQVRNSPTRLEFTLSQGSLRDLSLSKNDGSALLPDDTTQALLNQVRLALSDNPAAVDGSYIILTDKEQVISQLTTSDDTPVADFKVTKHADNDGLALRSALQAQGQTQGYTRQEIDRAEKEAGVTFPPEVRFFWSSVKSGKIADGQQGEIFASSLTADFGDLPAGTPLPTARATDIVQPLPEHKLWLEIAYDQAKHYAVDLAPGAAGAIGQIIGRSTDGLLPPQLVAFSLSQFITGDWVSDEEAAQSWGQQTLKRSWVLPSQPLANAPEAPSLPQIPSLAASTPAPKVVAEEEKSSQEPPQPLEETKLSQTLELVDDAELVTELAPEASISAADTPAEDASAQPVSGDRRFEKFTSDLNTQQGEDSEYASDETSFDHKKLPRKLKKKNQKETDDSPSSISDIEELSTFVNGSLESSYTFENQTEGLSDDDIDTEMSATELSPVEIQQPTRRDSLNRETLSPSATEEYDSSALRIERERAQQERQKTEESGFRAALKRFFIG